MLLDRVFLDAVLPLVGVLVAIPGVAVFLEGLPISPVQPLAVRVVAARRRAVRVVEAIRVPLPPAARRVRLERRPRALRAAVRRHPAVQQWQAYDRLLQFAQVD